MSTFARDTYTWATYAVFALLGFVQSSLGPILPTLREELGLSYAVGGLHLSTFALGALLASLAAPRAVGALDLRRVLWLSVCGMAGGCLLLAAARSATVTLLATGVIGVFTAWIVGAVQALRRLITARTGRWRWSRSTSPRASVHSSCRWQSPPRNGSERAGARCWFPPRRPARC